MFILLRNFFLASLLRGHSNLQTAIIYFFFGTAFLAAALDFEGDPTFFGFGALGFLAGPALADVFFSFDGVFGLLAFTDFLAGDLGDFGFDDDFFAPALFGCFLATDAFVPDFFSSADAAFGLAIFLVPTDLLAGFFLPPGADDPLALTAASLKDPAAPLPFVCTKAPLVTADLKYFLINGADFSESIL